MENVLRIVQLVILALTVFAGLVPLAVKLYNVGKELVKEKNWPQLVLAVSRYMAEAEKNMTDGASKKAWVISMVKLTAEQINYDLTEADIRNIEDLIDALCDMTKIVNAGEKAE